MATINYLEGVKPGTYGGNQMTPGYANKAGEQRSFEEAIQKFGIKSNTLDQAVVDAKKKGVPTGTEVKKPQSYWTYQGKKLTPRKGEESVTLWFTNDSAVTADELAKIKNDRPTENMTADQQKLYAQMDKGLIVPKTASVYGDDAGNRYAKIGNNWYEIKARTTGTTREETEFMKPLVEDTKMQKAIETAGKGAVSVLVRGAVVPTIAYEAAKYLLKDKGKAIFHATKIEPKLSGGTDQPPIKEEETNLMPEIKTEEKVYELPDQYKALRMAMASQKAEPINIGKLRGKQGILEKITEGALQGGGQAIADKLRGIQGEIEFDKQIAPQLERTYGARFRQSGAPDDYLKTLKESGTTTYASPENKTPEEENKAIMMEAMNLYKMIQENAERQDKLQYAKELIAERAKYYKPNQASLLESTIIQALTKNQSK